MRTTLLSFLILAACGGSTATSTSPATDDAGGGDAGSTPPPSSSCTLTSATTATSTVDSNGCVLLDRDTSACRDARTSQGITGAWLGFSCRVTLTKTADAIEAKADGQPDYTSMYFPKSNACYAEWASGFPNPNSIAPQSLVVDFPLVPTSASQAMSLGVVGLAIDGVPIFSNVAAPGDDIYAEAKSFDRCAGHPQMTGVYHFHTEPPSISQDDARLIGVLRDGYAVYGRRDADGSTPTLDAQGGHTGTTSDSTTAVYHYHVNQQTSTAPGTTGDKAWFLTTGTFHGAPGSCTGCR